jgi:hypothetical protein
MSQGTKLNKIAVIAIRNSDLNRRLFEDEMCSLLRDHGVQAAQGYTLMHEQPYSSGDTLLDQFRGSGFDGVLISNFIGVRSDVVTTPSTRIYVPETRYHRFGNYYSTVMMEVITPGTETVYEYVQIQTHLYRASDGGLIWGAQSETARTGDIQGRIEDYSRSVIKDLVKNGYIHR